MDEYAGRVLADRYRLPLPPAGAFELSETPAFDSYSGQEVLVRQVLLPEVVEAEVLDGQAGTHDYAQAAPPGARATRRPADPAVRRAMEAAQAAARIPDHPRLDQVFDVFAEDGSLWIVSEAVPARPLAALLAERPLTPYRAAEVAADVLTALRVLHAHGWVHRNITARTVLVCEDGRVMLTGLAAGAAEEALCGYDPVPVPEGEEEPAPAGPEPASPARPDPAPQPELPATTAQDPAAEARAARAGAIAAYRAGTSRAAARLSEEQRRRLGEQPAPAAEEPEERVPGRIADPYGVGAREQAAPSWHGATPRPRDPAAGEQDGDEDRPRLPHQDHPEPYGTAHRDPHALPPGLHPEALAPGDADPSPYADHVVLPSPDHLPVAAVPYVPEQAAVELEKPAPASWDEVMAAPRATGGPDTPLEAERARQARMTVVGAVTERWAPEQAGPVHDRWQLAAPVGPAADLWALGALLFRTVQGHAPYPEESVAELVQMVCAEPPAFAEECGPLRPVVESLLRQDPTERPDFEELSGWLRSLVRSAPEPDAGRDIVAAPPYEPRKLPEKRRRGDLVRRRGKRRRGAAAAPRPPVREERPAPPAPRAEYGDGADLDRAYSTPRARRAPRQGRPPKERGEPKSLGRTLLLSILGGVTVVIVAAVLFLPKEGEGDGVGPAAPPAPSETREAPAGSAPPEAGTSPDGGNTGPTEDEESEEPPADGNAPEVAEGFTLRKDAEGFQVAVAKGWQRQPRNGRGQVVYTNGSFELIVVPGRDSTSRYGDDLLEYQLEHERELDPYRASSWTTSQNLRLIEVGGRSMAEGTFTWDSANGTPLYVRNLAMLVGDRYHVVQVRGPDAERDQVDRLFEQASGSYTPK
ncbi:nuclease PIN [Streptomyces albidoflavus]|uniref:protein kinase domain-containing protein n=1 Tax=unclassified Streptomyces TaxID=2593676 RepID=UPI001165300F|nr:protein kinase [Streptomyces sp. BSP1]MCQ9708415.1 protein kinase [Streptomyces sp. BSP1]QDD60381.1 nuclease PIN [Streptomyces albidoflavus]